MFLREHWKMQIRKRMPLPTRVQTTSNAESRRIEETEHMKKQIELLKQQLAEVRTMMKARYSATPATDRKQSNSTQSDPSTSQPTLEPSKTCKCGRANHGARDQEAMGIKNTLLSCVT